MQEYEDIFSSPTEVPLRYHDKHSIDLNPNALLHDVAIPHVNTQTKSTHVFSKAIKFIERIHHVRDILEKSNTKFSRIFLSWRNLTQWVPLLPKEGGMIQVDIGGHPPIPFGPPPSVLSIFQFQLNLLFLALFSSPKLP